MRVFLLCGEKMKRFKNRNHISNIVIGKHNFESEYYPINFEPADNYVFFSTLLDKEIGSVGRNVGTRAERILYNPTHNPTTTISGQANERIIQALTFLKNAAEFQYQQENKFFNFYLNKASPELKEKITKIINSNDSDKYFNLINELNTILKGSDRYKKEIQKELNRINQRINIMNFDEKAAKAGRSAKNQNLTNEEWAERNALIGDDSFGDTPLNPYYNLNSNEIFKSMFSDKSNFSIIVRKVIENFGGRIFQLKKDKLQLNNRQVAVLIKILVQETYNTLAIEYRDVFKKIDNETRLQRNERIMKTIEKITENNGDIDKFFNSLVESVDLNSTLDSIADQYGIPQSASLKKSEKQRKTTNTFTRRLKEAWKKEHDAGRTSKEFNDWRKQYGATVQDLKEIQEITDDITVQTYYTNENMAVTELVQNGIYAALSTGKKVTEDFQAGQLIFSWDLKSSDEKRKKMIRAAEKKLADSQRKLSNKLKTTTGLKSYLDNIKIYKEMQEEQKQILMELSENLGQDNFSIDEMLSHINIHGTVKGYASISATRSEFEGAAFGSNIVSQVDIINEMLMSGGISDLDANWLLFALINCGKGMIGERNKNTLEDYLSAFVGLLMFNDASEIVKNTVDFINNSYEENSVQDIHLYVLNNIYIPSSYILNETYKRLSKIFLNVDAENKVTHGTRLTLNTYTPDRTSGFSKEELRFPSALAWKEERRNALLQTKLIMTFMGGFLTLIRNLNEQMSSLF